MAINKTKEQELKDKLNNFLQDGEECQGEECIVPSRDGLIEVDNKKFVVKDGRQLLR